MKKYILSLMMAVFAFIVILPLKAAAAESAISVTDQEGGTASVKLTLPNAAQEKISTLSLSLMFKLTDEESDVGEITYGVEFSDWVKQNAKVQTSRSSHKEVLNIYIAGTTPLFSAGDGKTLDVGEVFVKNGAGEYLPFQIDVENSVLDVVRGRNTVRISENDLAGDSGSADDPNNPDNPNEPDRPDNPDDPGNLPEEDTSENEAVRAELKAMLEKAESIPGSNRTKALQSAIDEARRVYEDTNASLEELKTALMDLENALALYESNANSGINGTDSAKEKAQQNRRQNGSVTQAARTSDTNPVIFCILVIVLSAAVFAVNACYRRRARESSSNQQE